MSDVDAPTALRKIRESAGISLREAARIVGKGNASTYAHYEDRQRYKRSYIPVDIVEPLAAELEQRGIDPQLLWDLTGNPSRQASASGLADVGLTKWEPSPHEDRHSRIVAAMTDGNPNYCVFTVRDRALELRGYLPGDFVIVDVSARTPANDVAVCAQVRDWEAMRAKTLLRIYTKPVLVSASTNPAFASVYMVDDNAVTIEGTVIGSYRWL